MKTPVLFALLLILPAALFGEETLDQRVREIAHQLRCPTCQAMSVKESEAGLATNMKMKIREMLREGKSEKEILAFFVQRYGEWILRSPKKEGINLLLWFSPGILIALAALGLFFRLKGKNAHTHTTDLPPLSAQEKAEINQALKEIEP